MTIKSLQKKLLLIYPHDHPATIIERAGTEFERVIKLKITDLATLRDFHPLSCIFLPPQAGEASILSVVDYYYLVKSRNISVNQLLDDSAGGKLLAALEISRGDVRHLASSAFQRLLTLLPDGFTPESRFDVRWELLKVLAGQFVIDPKFRQEVQKNSSAYWTSRGLNARERLIMEILDEWPSSTEK